MLTTIGTIIGYVATVESLFIYVAKKRGNILKLKLLNDALWCLNFALLGTYTGAVLNFIAMVRESIFFFKGRKKWASHIIWLFIFICLMLTSPIIVWLDPMRSQTEKFIQIFPAIGSILGVITFYLSKEQAMRVIGFVAQMPWLIYNGYNQNVPAIIGTSLSLASIIWGYAVEVISLKKNRKKSNENHNLKVNEEENGNN